MTPARRSQGIFGVLMAVGEGLTHKVESVSKTRNLWERFVGPVLEAKLEELDAPKEVVDPVEFAKRIGILKGKKRRRIAR